MKLMRKLTRLAQINASTSRKYPKMQKAVIDTNILVSGLLTVHGKPGQIINALSHGTFIICYCDEILEEYEDVLVRPKFSFNPITVNKLLHSITKLGYFITPKKSSIEFIDESDRIFYDTAIAAKAYLITGNGKHYPSDSRTVTPAQFIENI
jgi:putative PIN family toxin of toxin-antitoxin system